MVSVRITRGTYGWSHDGRYDLVPAGASPIDVSDEIAERLIKKGVAELVSAAPSFADNEQTEQPEELDLYSLSAKDLREAGRKRGITFKVGMTKSDMIDAINAAEPDQEDAPVFDASEAVQ